MKNVRMSRLGRLLRGWNKQFFLCHPRGITDAERSGNWRYLCCHSGARIRAGTRNPEIKQRVSLINRLDPRSTPGMTTTTTDPV